MSQKSSAKNPRLRDRMRRLAIVVLLPLWTIASVFFAGKSIVMTVFVGSLPQLNIDRALLDNTVMMMVLSVLVYLIGLAVLLIEPYALRSMGRQQISELLGIVRRIQIRDVMLAFLSWAGYFLCIVVIANLVAIFFQSIDINQAQEIGFQTEGSNLDKLYAGIVLVIAAPIVEEIIFRGYLQGNLRRMMPWWLGAAITSLTFGVVHGQLNVGIDTFILSMVACYLREKTGAIYAGIGLHMIKNGIAYYMLFWAPHWLTKLLGI